MFQGISAIVIGLAIPCAVRFFGSLRPDRCAEIVNEMEAHIHATTADNDSAFIANLVTHRTRRKRGKVNAIAFHQFVQVNPPRHARGGNMPQDRMNRIAWLQNRAQVSQGFLFKPALAFRL